MTIKDWSKLVKNPIFHSRTKHIDIRQHFIREAYEEKKIDPKYVGTEEMTAKYSYESAASYKASLLRYSTWVFG